MEKSLFFFKKRNIICSGYGKIIFLAMSIVLSLVSTRAFSQDQITVSGTVTDETGIVLPGVSIVQKETTTGVVTDVDGKYSLDVFSNSTLVFSFIGMETQEILVGTKSIIDVTLNQATIVIDEVVAIGYGTQTKSTLTSAVTQVKAEFGNELCFSG